MSPKRIYSLTLIAFWVFVAIISFVQSIATSIMQHKEIVLRWQLITPIGWLVWVILTPFVIMMIRRNPLKWGDVKGALLRVFGMIVAISTVHIIILLIILNVYWFFETGESFPSQTQYWFLCPQTFTTNFLVLIVIIGVTMSIDNYFINKELHLKSTRLEAQLAQAKIAALRRQLQPHFLFNTLNALNTLILKKDHEKAERMLNKLSSLLRETIEAKDDKWVSLNEELKITKLYLEIHEVRFGERLKVEYDIDPDSRNCRVPNFLLQPLVENALAHGIGKTTVAGLVRITTRLDQGRLNIEIFDNGPGIAPEELQEGVGLSNTRNRLKEMYQSDFNLHFHHDSPTGFIVTIEIPCTKHEDA